MAAVAAGAELSAKTRRSTRQPPRHGDGCRAAPLPSQSRDRQGAENHGGIVNVVQKIYKTPASAVKNFTKNLLFEKELPKN